MKLSAIIAVAISTLIATAASSLAGVLAPQFGISTSPVQAGFTLTLPNNTPSPSTFPFSGATSGTASLAMQCNSAGYSPSPGAFSARDRGIIVGDTSAYSSLYRSLVFTTRTDIRLALGGLIPNATYDIQSWSWDREYGGGIVNYRLYDLLAADSNLDPGTWIGSISDTGGTWGDTPTTPSSATINFQEKSGTSGAIVFGVSRVDALGVTNTSEAPMINAVTIQRDPDLPSIMGSGNFSTSDTNSILTAKIGALQAAGATACRVALSTPDYYPGGNAGVSTPAKTLINALVAAGITPYVHFEYYQNEYGWGKGPILSYNWTAVGAAFAGYFGTNVPYYAAVNEPDMAIYTGGTSAVIPPADYATALGNLASGVHSVNSALKVIPGGYGAPASYHSWTAGGYPAAIASLLSSGALDGIDLHIYWSGDNYTPITNWDMTSEQGEFQHVKSSCGLGDIKLYCTEFNQNIVSGTGQYSVNETQAAQRLLTLAWSVLGTTKNNDSSPDIQIAFPWSLVEQEANYGLYTVLSPWTPNARGVTMQLIMSLTSGMSFSSFTNGVVIMTAPNKALWVVENISSWKTVSANYTCNGIPSTATKLLRYGYDGLRETVGITPGTSTYTFTDIPLGETTMILATP
jgi:hypothetical protein